jgi:voltage-gated sodium channel
MEREQVTRETRRWELWRTRLKQIKSSRIFEILIITVIVVSAIAVGAHSYSLSPETIKALVIADYAISVIFCLEIAIRILAEDKVPDFFRSGWNIFDFTIVAVSIIPIAGTQVVWVARLVRIFRVLRLIVYVPQLRIIIDTLLKAIPRIGYVVLLMFILFYMYGTIGNMFFGEINPVLWGNVSISMLTLFRVLSLEDWTDVMYETMEVYPLSWIYYLSFIFLVAFVFLNIMVAIVIDVWLEERRGLEEAVHGDDGKPLRNSSPAPRVETLEDRMERLEQEVALLSTGTKGAGQ